jgi:hypothetical protein
MFASLNWAALLLSVATLVSSAAVSFLPASWRCRHL